MPCGTWIQTFTGKSFDFIDMEERSIDPIDIAHSLAHRYRWSGHTREAVSVAAHSLVVANLLPPHLKLYGLLHDAEECYTGDIVTPMMRALEEIGQVGSGNGLKSMKDRAQEAVRARFGLPIDLGPEVHHADLISLSTERHLYLSHMEWGWDPPPPSPEAGAMFAELVKLSPRDCAHKFLRTWLLLTDGAHKMEISQAIRAYKGMLEGSQV